MRRDMREEEVNISFTQVIRAVGGLFGLLVILVGLICSIRVFGLIMDGLQSPDNFGVQFDKWVEAVGGSEWDLVLGETTIHGARFIAFGVIGVGTLILVGLSLTLLKAGANVIKLTVGDKDAVKQILEHALGKKIPLKEPAKETSSTAMYPVN